jgi:hypothetical protein
MAGFKKASPEQAALKFAIYGPPGSGKTFTTLLVAEGLAGVIGKKVALVDTERGSDFYCQPVATRPVHPEAFAFDALYTRSLTEVLAEVKRLDPAQYGVVIIDSITHLWESAKASYSGKTTKVGTIPLFAWGKIKAPYKELMNWALNSPFHVFLLGRQGTDFQEDEETGEMRSLGPKMKAEGETPYEPHTCIRMESVRAKKGKGQLATYMAIVEKDRTGVLAGQCIVNPTFDTIARPLLPLLGSVQAQLESEEDAGARDAEALSLADRQKEAQSQQAMEEIKAHFALAKSLAAVEEISKTITLTLKRSMLTAHVNELRDAYLVARQRLKNGGGGNGETPLAGQLRASIDAVKGVKR